LGANFLMINVRYENSESNTVTVANDYRRIMMVRNPTLTSNGALATGSVYRQTLNLTLTSPSGAFSVDETLTGSTSGATAKVVDWNAAGNGNTARVSAVSKTFQVGEIVTGGTSGATGTVASISQPELRAFSGDVLYVEHRTPIVRANDQIESLKVIIAF
jgi:phage terminase large subunit-like protein